MNMYIGPSPKTFEGSKDPPLKSKSKSSNPSPKRKISPAIRSNGRAKNTRKPRTENNAIEIPPRSLPTEMENCADSKANIGDAMMENALNPILLMNPMNMRKNAPTVRTVWNPAMIRSTMVTNATIAFMMPPINNDTP